jgi:hypothetical protein
MTTAHAAPRAGYPSAVADEDQCAPITEALVVLGYD